MKTPKNPTRAKRVQPVARLTQRQREFIALFNGRSTVPAHADLCPAAAVTVRSLLRRGIIWEDAAGRMLPPVYRIAALGITPPTKPQSKKAGGV